MDALTEKLDARSRGWKPEAAAEAERIAETLIDPDLLCCTCPLLPSAETVRRKCLYRTFRSSIVKSVANVQGLGSCQLCVLNARWAAFPQEEWSG
jgi:hypothetical protein